jgi:hypothetical protein
MTKLAKAIAFAERLRQARKWRRFNEIACRNKVNVTAQLRREIRSKK